MKRLIMPAALFCAVSLASISVAEEADEGFRELFNGKTLEGWAHKPGGWRVEDGAITGQSIEEKPCKKHHYIHWTGGEPDSFDLRVTYRITGGNSGIHFRSKPRANWDMEGYQADIEAGHKWTGCLFEVYGRGGVVMRGHRAVYKPDGTKEDVQFADPAELMSKIKQGDWNEYRILAQGPRIRLFINDVLMCEVTDEHPEHARQKGVIGFQMHPGPPMTVQFKSVRLKELD